MGYNMHLRRNIESVDTYTHTHCLLSLLSSPISTNHELSHLRQERRQVEAAGVDYPTYSEVPPGLSFSCSDKIPGYYADPEAQCQVRTINYIHANIYIYIYDPAW